jgi:hypothetical protein
VFTDVNVLICRPLGKTVVNWAGIEHQQEHKSTPGSFAVSSPDSKAPSLIPPAASAARSSETFRARSVATRLTEAEFAEVDAAAGRAGKKTAEWLREAALAQARSAPAEKADPILLAELMAMRTLLLNLFSAASKGPLTDESLRKMLAYADSIKQQKADEFLAKLRAGNGAKPPGETP